MSLKVVLVDDHILYRNGLSRFLYATPSVDVVGEGKNGIEALELCQTLRPDVLLIDLHVPNIDGLECTRVLKDRLPNLKIVLLSVHNSLSYLLEAMSAGADAYVLKDNSNNELLLAIHKVHAGGKYVSTELTLTVLDDFKNTSRQTKTTSLPLALSEGEKQILELMAQGLTNTQMANKLFISIRTVESRRKKLLDKTGTSNTATLMKFAVSHGLVV